MRSQSKCFNWVGAVTSVALLAACSSSGNGPSLGPSASGPARSASASTASTSHAPLTGQIVFFDNSPDAGNTQIYIENADGSNVRRLVTSTYNDANPSLSPDGRRVAFTRYAGDGSPEDPDLVFTINIDGSDLRQVDTFAEDVSWSPDGKRLVDTRALFDAGADRPYSVALWVMDLDGSHKHQITLIGKRCENACPGGEQHNEAVWSPDGKRIAFKLDLYANPEQFSIYTVAPDGSDLRRVTPEGMNVGDPAWSPDGTEIAFQSPPEANEGGEQNIFTIHPDGSGIRQLTSHLSSSDGRQGTFHPSWSPYGLQILFSHNPGVIGPHADIFVMNADGSDVHVLAGTTLNENWANWGVLPGG